MSFLFQDWWCITISTKDTGKLQIDPRKVAEFWENTTSSGWLPANHPGKWGANVLGMYGDDARYSKAGEKFISISWNCILQESKRTLFWLQHVFVSLNDLSQKYIYNVIHHDYDSSASTVTPACPGLDIARYPIFVVRCALSVPDYTLMRVYQVVVWSLQVSCSTYLFTTVLWFG